jgi:microcystin-dependent protein
MLMKKSLIATTMLALGLASVSTPAQASLEPFIGQIMPTGFNFCPRGFAQASGQLLPIAQNTALFSLLGTTFGGDGRTTFALPNLNGRMPIGSGQGPGLPFYVDGEVNGSTSIQLTTSNLPSHTHSARLRAQSAAGNSPQPVRNSLATAPVGADIYSTAAPTVAMSTGNINLLAAGQGQAIANVTPSTVIKYCIALQGIFPSRN